MKLARIVIVRNIGILCRASNLIRINNLAKLAKFKLDFIKEARIRFSLKVMCNKGTNERKTK